MLALFTEKAKFFLIDKILIKTNAPITCPSSSCQYLQQIQLQRRELHLDSIA